MSNTTKKYVITDPCYILTNEEWKDACQYVDDWDKFENEIALKLTNLTGESAEVADTKVGDWSNELKKNFRDMDDCKLVQPYFAADSGMVCGCLYNDEVAKRLKDGNSDCYAIIEVDSNSQVDIIMDKDSEATIVRVEVDHCEVFTSRDESEDEDDYFNDYNESEDEDF